MKNGFKEKLNFTLRVVIIHTLTYVLCGLLLHKLFNYENIFTLDVIKFYMRPLNSPAVLTGPFLQPIRGLLFALGLWLLKPAWAGRKQGWLIIWGTIFLFGILNTPAAAPSSIEGYIYSRLPLWYHFMGYVEVGIQTLFFSILIFITQQSREQGSSIFERIPLAGEIMRAVALACFAYICYAVTSISLLFLGGYNLEFTETTVTTGSAKTINITEAAGDLTVQFMFLFVFIINILIVFVISRLLMRRKIRGFILFPGILILNILALLVYQLLFSEVMAPLMLIYMPSLAAVVLTVCLKKNVFAFKRKNADAT